MEYLKCDVDLSRDILVEVGVDCLETSTNHLQLARHVRQLASCRTGRTVCTVPTAFSQQAGPHQPTKDVILYQQQQFALYLSHALIIGSDVE